MRTTNTFGVHFTTRASKQGTLAAIYARITVDGRRIEMAIKKSIHPTTGIKPTEWLKAVTMRFAP